MGIGDRLCDGRADPGIEGSGQDIFRIQFLRGHQRGQCMGRCLLHFLVDIACPYVQRSAEEAGEDEDVVDLVRVIAPAGPDDRGAGGQGLIRLDFGHGVGHREENGTVGHGADHVLCDDVRRADADEHVGAFHGVCQGAGELLRIGNPGDLILGRVHPFTSFAQDADGVRHFDIPDAEVHQVFRDGDSGAARAVDDDLHFADLLADDLQGVDQCRADHDGGSVLVVMEDRDIADLLEPAFNLKTAGGGNILQVDAAEGAGDQVDRADDLVHVLAADADREGVYITEGLKQSALTLHDRHTSFRTDIAQAENGRTVRDDGNEIAPPGKREGFIIIFPDRQAGLGNARGIGERKIVLALDGDTRDNFDFSLPFAMQAQGFLGIIQRVFLLRNMIISIIDRSGGKTRPKPACKQKRNRRRGRVFACQTEDDLG